MSSTLYSAIANPWICPAPGEMPDRQMLFGDEFSVEDVRAGWAFGNAVKDGYRGWVKADALFQVSDTNARDVWRVAVRSTWGYERPDLKSRPLVDMHMTSKLAVVGTTGDWLEVDAGKVKVFVFAAHCQKDGPIFDTPVDAARMLLGTPYVWAGNSGFGLDCSGLIQVAMLACGRDCPADSHKQKGMDGQELSDTDALEPGDLIFWKGHVAMVTSGQEMIHANAHHMAVVEEEIGPAVARIAATDTGDVTFRLRPMQ